MLAFRKTMVSILFAFMTVTGCGMAHAYQTENVFLVVIDGLRYTESFGDSTHQFVPHIWNDLRPLGTIYSRFFNMGQTSTVSGYSTILSGKRQGYLVSPFRADEEPLFFEEWRAQLGFPQEKAWVLANYAPRLGGGEMAYSEHPAFGQPFAASAQYAHSDKDQDVVRILQDVLDTYQPRLTVVWLKAVDINGHLGDWNLYTHAVQIADELVYQIWLRIESDPYYQGRTTMIVTSDHGRHDDYHGGFKEHGDFCRGCRQVSFLAIGPDIRADTVVVATHSLIDIAPTVAELLGFAMPLSEGRILEEMLLPVVQATSRLSDHPVGRADNATRFTNSPGTSRDPSVAAFNGTFHITWMERDTLPHDEAWSVWHTTATDTGPPAPLFTGTSDLQIPIRTVVAGEENTGVVATAIYRNWLADDPSDSTCKWGISARNYTGDGSWSGIEVIAPPEFTAFPNGMSLSLTGGGGSVAAQENKGENLFAAQEDSLGGSWGWNIYGTGASLGETWEYPALSTWRGVRHMAWIAFQREFPRNSWFLPFYMRWDENGVRITELAPRTADDRRHMSLDSDASLVVAFWSKYLPNGHWELFWNRSLDGGMTWEDPSGPFSLTGAGTWRPDVAVSGHRIVVVWEDYRDGNAEIYCRSSSDDGYGWGLEQRLSSAPDYSIRPRVALYGASAYAVWQEHRDGNWEIYGTPVPLSGN